MTAARDDYADAERNPSETVNPKDEVGIEACFPVSTIADEYEGDGWVQRTMPYGANPLPISTSGTAGAGDNSKIKQGDDYNEAATSSQ